MILLGVAFIWINVRVFSVVLGKVKICNGLVALLAILNAFRNLNRWTFLWGILIFTWGIGEVLICFNVRERFNGYNGLAS